MKIALVYAEYLDVPESIEEINPDAVNHMRGVVSAITSALRKGGHEVVRVPANVDMLRNIVEIPNLDLIFCHYQPMENLDLQGNVFAALELLGIPIVGSGMFTQAIALSKETTKEILRGVGLPTAKSQIFLSEDDELKDELKDAFPLFIKPESEAASVGVTVDSYAENEEELRKGLKIILEDINPPILVEEYLPGREFTVGVLEEDPIITLPVLELVFTEDSVVNYRSIETKVENTMKPVCPADISEELAKEMQEIAVKAFKVLRADVYGRVDFRLDKDGRPQLIEFNTMPGLEKDTSLFAKEAAAYGIEYDDLINRMVKIAMKKEVVQKKLGRGKF